MSLPTQVPSIDRYSVVERLRLIEEIWDSIPDFPETIEVPQSHKDELDRRLVAMQDDPFAGSSWEDLEA